MPDNNNLPGKGKEKMPLPQDTQRAHDDEEDEKVLAKMAEIQMRNRAPGPLIKRKSSSRHQVAGTDAQEVYPAEACLFVANLPEWKDDEDLEVELYRTFERFGTVFIKVRRDASNMPFAFIQYTHPENAESARQQATFTTVGDRQVRIEKTRGNREFVMWKTSDSPTPITVDEGRRMLAAYGDIENVVMMDSEQSRLFGISVPAIRVTFERFKESRNIEAALKHNNVYRVANANRPAAKESNQAYLRRMEVDRRSIFVGNLPDDITHSQILHEFALVGPVRNVEVVRRFHENGNQAPVFAFVEFAREDLPDKAIDELNGMHGIFPRDNGGSLRVERKVNKKSQRGLPARRGGGGGSGGGSNSGGGGGQKPRSHQKAVPRAIPQPAPQNRIPGRDWRVVEREAAERDPNEFAKLPDPFRDNHTQSEKDELWAYLERMKETQQMPSTMAEYYALQSYRSRHAHEHHELEFHPHLGMPALDSPLRHPMDYHESHPPRIPNVLPPQLPVTPVEFQHRQRSGQQQPVMPLEFQHRPVPQRSGHQQPAASDRDDESDDGYGGASHRRDSL